MVTSGLGINVLVNSTYNIPGDWMAFSLCYSIHKFLPDASIFIKYTKKSQVSKQLFRWITSLNIKNISKLSEPFLNLESTFIMIRPMETVVFDLAEVCSEVKEDKFTPFVSYQKGCGKFVVEEWINKEEYPFAQADSFMTEDVCANEIQVLKLWRQMNTLYPLLTRG
jgi:hypothetical protein